jgi:predicted site-specific integrase-resolvase
MTGGFGFFAPRLDGFLNPEQMNRQSARLCKTVTRWAKEGKLASRRTLGGHRRYARADIESPVERLEGQIPA